MNQLQLLVVCVMVVGLVMSTLQPVIGSDLEVLTSRHKRAPGFGGGRGNPRSGSRGRGGRGGRRGRRDASLDEEDDEALTSRHRRAAFGGSGGSRGGRSGSSGR
ncbi:hypothetical protein BaRGS_00027661 [Batillaria attramentaria]|uniref:Uncharacterized protein n=1 Tax=Batillaria attramentaria TaxID=370345 RepID=A0ABD0K289_9CAEN